ncbi:MAG TPA: HEAT repeat domain-containing protein [Polyangiaceae bacterium]|jgi:hypothetical protein
MASLSASIVNQHVASVHDVEEALARQAIHGGDLVTNLLEIANVNEEKLALVLAQAYDLEPAPIGELPKAPESVRRLVPVDLASRFALYPLEERAGTLLLAVAEPLPAEVENDLSFSLGATLVQRLALLVRVREAIARDYTIPLDRRSLRVLAKLAGRPDPSPSSLPSRARGADGSLRPLTVNPGEPRTLNTPKDVSIRSLAPQVPRAPALPDLSGLRREPSATRPRRLGPYTATAAEKHLLESSSRDDVLRAFFDFASQYFEYAALFAVQGDLAEGRDAHGSGAARARVVGIGVPLDLPSALSRVRDSANYEITRLGSGGLDGALAKDLERRAGRAVLLLPIRVRGRVVLILYGDHGDQDVELSAVGEVISFAPFVTSAIERLIVKRKLGDKADATTSLPVRRPRERSGQPIPGVGERTAALAGVIEAKRIDSADAPATTRAVPVPRGSQNPAPAAPTASTPPSGRPAAPAMRTLPLEASKIPPRKLTPAPTSALARPVLAIGGKRANTPPHGLAQQAPTSPKPAPTHVEPPESGWASPPSARAPDSAPKAPKSEPKPHVGTWPPAAPEVPAPEPPPASLRGTAAPRLELVSESNAPPRLDESPEIAIGAASFDEDLPPDSGVPLAPASRSLAHSARPPPPREDSSEMRLPTVIVDLANDCNLLVNRLVSGDASASDQLVRIGAAAIPVLAGAFPGPIEHELRRGIGDGAPRASDCGPVLRVLARFGPQAVPFIVVRSNDGDANVRAWATRLLGELPTEESAQAVARRLADDDDTVRRAALASGSMLLAYRDVAEELQAVVSESVSDTQRSEQSRHMLIESIAELRATLTIPTLIRLLDDPTRDIVRSAQWALTVIARQDFGSNAAAWDDWWRKNSGRHRIEWLIDSLLHDNQEVRRNAGDELKSLTKEYFGYYDDLPKKERERAEERYRKWWETKGKARFR